MRQRSAIARASLLLLCAACAGGTRPSPDLIPAPLASALMDGRWIPAGGAREFTVAALPPGYPATLVPPGPVRIVGGMTNGGEITVILADSTRRLAAVLEEHFAQAGYTRPAATPGSGFSSPSGPFAYFCREGAMVSAEPVAGSNGLARVSYRPRPRPSPCVTPPPAPPPVLGTLELPELTPPSGTRVRRAGSGSGGDGVDSRAEMSGKALVPEAVVAHYAAQLVAAGWTASAPAVSPRVAAQFFEARDSAGATWEGVLVAAGSDSTLALTLNMRPRAGR